MKSNNFIKTLRIILLTLSIILAVFALMKKVGLAASDSSSGYISRLPFVVGAGYGNTFTSAQLETITTIMFNDANGSGDYQLKYFVLVENGSRYIRCRGFADYNNTGLTRNSFTNNVFPLDGSFTFSYNSAGGYRGYREVSIDKQGYVINTTAWLTGDAGRYTIPCANYTEQSANNTYIQVMNRDLPGMPLYITNDLVFDGVTYFSNTPSASFDSPGFSAGFNQWVEDNQNPVDDTPPADLNSNPGWLQKILNGIKTLNNTIGGWFQSIQNTLNNFFGWFTEPFDQQAFEDEFMAIPVIHDFTSLGGLVSSSGVFDWSDVTPANRLAFTFDFGGAVLPHHQYEINFDWYTGSVKTTILAVLTCFVVIGLLATIINQIPSIIGGKSGDKGGGSE